MTGTEWGASIGLALVAGVVAGGWITWQISRLRHASQSRRELGEMQRKYGSTIDQLRAAQVRAQTELEQAKNSFKRQLAVVAEEPRAATARAEERLRAAYAELDRVRGDGQNRDTLATELSDGFAATRPMREGL